MHHVYQITNFKMGSVCVLLINVSIFVEILELRNLKNAMMLIKTQTTDAQRFANLSKAGTAMTAQHHVILFVETL